METPIKYESEGDLAKVHDEAMQRFRDTMDRERTSRELSMEDKIFNVAQGGQWQENFWNNSSYTSGVKNASGNDQNERPRFEVNLISPVISRLVGEQRRVDIGPKVVPIKDSDADMAEIRQGIIRHIEKISNARDIYDNAYDEALQGGYGGWQVVTQYVDDDVFDQEIRLEPINDATTSLFFGPSKRYDKSDAPYAFLVTSFEIGVFKATFPKAEKIEFDAEVLRRSTNSDWFSDNSVRVAVYYRKVSEKKTIIQLSDGRIVDEADVIDVLDELAMGTPVLDVAGNPVIDEMGNPVMGDQVTVVNRREVESFRVEKFLLNGSEIIDKVTDYKGRYIPLIPMYGEEIILNGASFIHGKVRFAKDSQRVFNYALSSMTEKAAMGPADFIWMTPEQMAGHERDLAAMNVSRKPVQQYNAVDDDGNPLNVPPPFPNQGPIVQSSLIQLVNDMRVNVYATMGSSGQTTTDGTALDSRSGEAIKQGAVGMDTGSYVYQDNLLKSIAYSYHVIDDLIGKIMDTERQVQIVQPDDTVDTVTINETVIDAQTGKRVTVNDLSVGKFSIDVRSGPAFASQRAEAADRLIELTANDPEMRAVANDIIVSSMDGPKMEELAKRLKANKYRTGQLIPDPEEAEELGINIEQVILEKYRPQIEQEIMQSAQVQVLTNQADALAAQAEEYRSRAQRNVMDGNAKMFDAEGKASKTIAEIENIQVKTNREAVEAQRGYLDMLVVKAKELGLPISVMDRENMENQSELVELTHFSIDPGLVGPSMDRQIAELNQYIQSAT